MHIRLGRVARERNGGALGCGLLIAEVCRGALFNRGGSFAGKGATQWSVAKTAPDPNLESRLQSLRELYAAVGELARLADEDAFCRGAEPPQINFLSTLVSAPRALPNGNGFRREGEEEQVEAAGDDDNFNFARRRQSFGDDSFTREFGSSKTGREVVVSNPKGREIPYIPTRMVPCAFASDNQAWIVRPTVATLDKRSGVGLFILKAFAEATRRSLSEVWRDAVIRNTHEKDWTRGLYGIFGFEREPLQIGEPFRPAGLHSPTYRQHSAFSKFPPGREGDAGLYCMVMAARWQRLHREAFAFFRPDEIPDFVELYQNGDRRKILGCLARLGMLPEDAAEEGVYKKLEGLLSAETVRKRRELVRRAHAAQFGREEDWRESLTFIFDSNRLVYLKEKANALAKSLFPDNDPISDLEHLLLLSEATRQIKQWLHHTYFPAMEAAEPWNSFVAPGELDVTWGNLLTPPIYSIALCDALARMDSDKGWFCWKLLYNPGPESASGDGPFAFTSEGLRLAKPKRVMSRRQHNPVPMPHIAFHIEDSPDETETHAVKLLHPRQYEQFENRSSSARTDRRTYVAAIAHLGINKRAKDVSAMVRPLDLQLGFFQKLQRRLKESPLKLAELTKYNRSQPPHFSNLGLIPRRIWAVADYGFAQMPDIFRTNEEFQRKA